MHVGRVTSKSPAMSSSGSHTALHARSPRSEAEWEWVQVRPNNDGVSTRRAREAACPLAALGMLREEPPLLTPSARTSGASPPNYQRA